MDMNTKQRMSSVVQMISYMVKEIENNMSKYILASTNEDNKYAINSNVLPTLKVQFGLYNTANETLAYGEYTYEVFATICSDVSVMESTFLELADNLVDAVQKQSTIPIKVTKKSRIIV